jgi:hypothetical protein
MVVDVASLPFAQPCGPLLKGISGLGLNYPLPGADANAVYSMPGIMRLEYEKTVGGAVNNTSAINVAAQTDYTWNRHMNSGASNYEPADQMIYNLGVMELINYIGFMRRIYGAVNLTSVTNRYLPKALTHAVGGAYESITGHLAELRSYINAFTLKTMSFALAADKKILRRRFLLDSCVFFDTESNKAQIYCFVPKYFYRFDATGSEKGGRLVKEMLPNQTGTGTAGMTYNQIREFGDRLMNSMFNNEDIGIISGDIKKAYNDLVTMDLIGADYTVPVSNDRNVLHQIMNATVFPSDDVLEVGAIEQESGLLRQAITYKRVGAYRPLPTVHLLNFYQATNPTPDEVMEATRCCLLPEQAGDDFEPTVDIAVCPTEIITSMSIYANPGYMSQPVQFAVGGASGIDEVTRKPGSHIFINSTAWNQTAISNEGLISLVSAFDYHPTLILYEGEVDDGIVKPKDNGFRGLVQELQTYTQLHPETLNNMHEVAVLGLFKSPVIGSVDKM